MGVIATIIAAKKGHTTFAWFVGAWTAIAFLLAVSTKGAGYVGPGILFLCIAIGMRDLKKVEAVAKSEDDSVKPAEEETEDIIPDDAVFVTPTIDKTTGYLVCPQCRKTMSQGRKKCFNCGVYFKD